MENFLLSLDRKRQIKMLEDALKEDRFDVFQTKSDFTNKKTLLPNKINMTYSGK